MTGWRQQGLREGRAAVDGIGLIQGDREATEHCNDWHSGEASSFWEAAAQLNAERYDGWHSGKRAAAGKCKQRGLREGRAAVDGKRRERERRDHWG